MGYMSFSIIDNDYIKILSLDGETRKKSIMRELNENALWLIAGRRALSPAVVGS
jgi:hypothetical protein